MKRSGRVWPSPVALATVLALLALSLALVPRAEAFIYWSSGSIGREARGKVKLNPTYKLKPKKVELTTGETKTLKLEPKKAKAKKIARALGRDTKARARLTVTLTDRVGNTETERLRVRLKR